MAIIDYGNNLHRETDIIGAQVYHAGNGRGQGCGTVWYPSVSRAEQVLAQFGKAPSGEDSGLCEQCSCHYSSFTKEFKKYPEFACQEWKRQIAEKEKPIE